MVDNTPEFIKNIVVSTRIRLARNFAGFPFPSKMKPSHEKEVVHLVEAGLQAVEREGYVRYDMETMKDSMLSYFEEKKLISPALLRKKKNRAFFLSADQEVSIMVNEEDHLREQYIAKGFQLYKAYERLSALDDGLADALDFAYDKKLGYLTACPSNLGTGLRASVMMYLPGLTWTGEIKDVRSMLQGKDMTIRGSKGEGTAVEGCLYQISNERTLGLSEKEILDTVTEFAMKICNLELLARDKMLAAEETELRDRCLRAYGTLTNCALLDASEFETKIADVRLGLTLGFLKTKDWRRFEEFVDDMQPAAFCLNNNLQGESERYFDEVRAETVGMVLPKVAQVIKRGR